ncbi:hypothetical protein, partial [Kribbella sp. NPDC048915]|uniref:hypothetical protein n=1 Tax=Kribbella sp. NPDC048915 TaxID=3155148 RepID=UPI0033DBD01F
CGFLTVHTGQEPTTLWVNPRRVEWRVVLDGVWLIVGSPAGSAWWSPSRGEWQWPAAKLHDSTSGSGAVFHDSM